MPVVHTIREATPVIDLVNSSPVDAMLLLQQDVEPTLVRIFDDGHTKVTFTYIPGGYLIYQCQATTDNFLSKNYRHYGFQAQNGVELVSKNSPIVIDENHLYLQGGFPDFALKPAVMHVGDKDNFIRITDRFIAALYQFAAATSQEDFKPRVHTLKSDT